MNPRLAKELRPLLLPWSIAGLAACGHLVALFGWTFANGAFGSLLIGLAGTAFVIGCLVLAAMPLGSELHGQTLALLLSQPTSRMRLWKDKLVVAAMAVLALGIIHGLASALAGQLHWQQTLACLLFMAAAVCSVGYWTLATGSVLVGIACAVSAPIGIAASVHLVVYYFLGIDVQFTEQTALVLGVTLCIGYCVFFLWLGQRQFVGLELKAGVVVRLAQIPQALVPRQLTELFQCRPTGAVVNLIRKEVHLQKPIFLVSAIFTVGWLLTLLLMLVRPAWHDNCIAVFNGLTGTQVALMAILTGCVSLGDDKALGGTAWHLTLPLSTRRQWFIKLSVAAGTAIGVAVVLPTLLAALTLFEARVGFLAIRPGDVWGLLVPCAVVFVLSFWSASLVSNTVRAALTCMIALIGAAGCVFLGFAVPQSFFAPPPGQYVGLQTGLVTQILAQYQLPPDYFMNHGGLLAYGTLIACLAFVSTALFQSLRLFGRLQTKATIRIKYAVILAAVAFGGSFWCADMMKSISRQSPLVAEVTDALASVLRQDGKLSEGRVRTVTPQELESDDLLSNTAKRWLRNSTIDVHWTTSSHEIPSFARRYVNGPRSYIGELHLPKVTVHLSWTAPDPPQAQPPKEKP
jgi:hypothetical protein